MTFHCLNSTVVSGARSRDCLLSSQAYRRRARNDPPDPRQVRTKNAKTFTSVFFPVSDDFHDIAVNWIRYLREENSFGPDDPLFPSPRSRRAATSNFAVSRPHLETSLHHLEQVFSLRLLLEAPATYRATSLIGEEELWQLAQSIESFRKASVRNTWKHLELDAKFHRIVMRASGDRRLADFVDTLRDLQMMRGRLDRREDTDPRRHLRRPSADFRPGRRPRPSGGRLDHGRPYYPDLPTIHCAGDRRGRAGREVRIRGD